MSLLDETLRYLGWRGQTVDDALRSEVGGALEEAQSLASPRYIWRVFPLSGETVEGTPLVLSGEAIKPLLTHAREVALMAATLGQTLDSAISRYSRFNVSRALLLDAAATALAEAACDDAEAEIKQHAASLGLCALPRFSPGYGDLPLTLQPVLLSALDASRRLGLTVTPTSLLIPRKSVTAIVALAPEDAIQAMIRVGCADCGKKDCPYPSCLMGTPRSL